MEIFPRCFVYFLPSERACHILFNLLKCGYFKDGFQPMEDIKEKQLHLSELCKNPGSDQMRVETTRELESKGCRAALRAVMLLSWPGPTVVVLWVWWLPDNPVLEQRVYPGI